MAENTRPVVPRYDSYPLDINAIIRLFVVGVFAGALGWLLHLTVSHFVIERLFCQSPDSFAICANGGTISWVAAHVIVLIATVAVLASMAVYRPLLIVLGAFFTLWSAHAWLGGLPWYQGVLWQALLFGLALAAFGWIARYSSFVVALIITILVVVLARFVLTLA